MNMKKTILLFVFLVITGIAYAVTCVQVEIKDKSSVSGDIYKYAYNIIYDYKDNKKTAYFYVDDKDISKAENIFTTGSIKYKVIKKYVVPTPTVTPTRTAK